MKIWTSIPPKLLHLDLYLPEQHALHIIEPY